MIYEIDLLNNFELQYIKKLFENLIFDDGKISNPGIHKVCEAVFDGPGNLEFNNYCHNIIANTALPFAISKISQIYCVKYNVGGQYKNHYDSNPCGGVRPDYSMTCFLSDDYTGGELVIENKTSVKLKRGKAILYPGNLLHRVNEVTSGRRDVFVCWIEL